MASLTTVETSYGSGSRPLGPLTWAALRAMDTSALHAGDFVEVSDLGYSHWIWNGTLWRPRAPVVLDSTGAAGAPVTGTANKTSIVTLTIPGGAMGLTGALRITTLWSATNNANAKTPRIELGGTAFSVQSVASVASAQFVTTIRNRGSAASQVSAAPGNQGTGTNSTAVSTGTVNTAVDQALVISGQLGTTTDSLTLEGRTVELLS